MSKQQEQEVIPMTTETALAVPETNTSVATVSTKRQARRYTDEQIALASLENANVTVPKLTEAAVSPIGITETYWSPAAEGESKIGYVKTVEARLMPDIETGEIKELECLVFIEEKPEGGFESFINAARILVANVKYAIERGEIVPSTYLTPVRITYLGEKKNRSNALKSGRWDIRRLMVIMQ